MIGGQLTESTESNRPAGCDVLIDVRPQVGRLPRSQPTGNENCVVVEEGHRDWYSMLDRVRWPKVVREGLVGQPVDGDPSLAVLHHVAAELIKHPADVFRGDLATGERPGDDAPFRLGKSTSE